MLEAGETYDRDALERQIGVSPKYHRYFDCAVAAIARRASPHLARPQRRNHRARPPLRPHLGDEQVAEFKHGFEQRYPANVGLMNLTFCCLSCYQEILTVKIDITEASSEKANMDIFTEVFRGGVVSDFFNQIVADAGTGRYRAAQNARGPKIRILEIGAGNGRDHGRDS